MRELLTDLLAHGRLQYAALSVVLYNRYHTLPDAVPPLTPMMKGLRPFDGDDTLGMFASLSGGVLDRPVKNDRAVAVQLASGPRRDRR